MQKLKKTKRDKRERVESLDGPSSNGGFDQPLSFAKIKVSKSKIFHDVFIASLSHNLKFGHRLIESISDAKTAALMSVGELSRCERIDLE